MSLLDFMILLTILMCVIIVGIIIFLGSDKDNLTDYEDDKKSW